MKKTKIICTMGPSTADFSLLVEMINAGMDMARFNFSHGDHAGHKKMIELVRKASEETGKPIGLICDTRGPEMRLGFFEGGRALLQTGDEFTLTTEEIKGDNKRAYVDYKGLPEELVPGNRILLADGMLVLEVKSIEGTEIRTQVLSGGYISDRKRVACPGVELKLPFLSEQDKKDIIFAAENGMDYIAASFVQNAENVFDIARILEERGSDIGVIAKIENHAGLQHIEDIIKASSGIMVARGDLGVEIPAEIVPMEQKKIIRKCNEAGKPVVTATQMLESMISHYRCTRAEASDVANSIFDGTDAIMLSGETASGSYPLEAVNTMARIAEATEASLDYGTLSAMHMQEEKTNSTDAISRATVQIADEIKADVIVTITSSGFTARNISKYRPRVPVVAITTDERQLRKLQLFWGVNAIMGPYSDNTDEMMELSVKSAVAQGCVKEGDSIVVTAGIPVGKPGSTNMIKVVSIGTRILSGQGVGKKSVSGKVCVCRRSEDFVHKFKPGMILAVDILNDEDVPYAVQAGGIVAEEGGYTSAVAIVGINYGIPVIIGAEDATKLLEDGQEVTLDSTGGVLYDGVIHA